MKASRVPLQNRCIRECWEATCGLMPCDAPVAAGSSNRNVLLQTSLATFDRRRAAGAPSPPYSAWKAAFFAPAAATQEDATS
jgi:hypothetical protein